MLIIFLFLHADICCGYSLEVSHLGTFNEYPQHMLSCRNKKKYLSGYSSYLPLSMLGKYFSRRHFEIFFLSFPENKIWHFMQTVSNGDNLHEISNPVFWENKKYITNLSSAVLAQTVVMVKVLFKLYYILHNPWQTPQSKDWTQLWWWWYFTSLLTLFKSYQNNGKVIMKGSVQWQ